MSETKQYRFLGKILVNSGIIGQQDLERALEEQKKSNVRLGDVLLKLKMVSSEDIEWALSDQFGLSLVYLKDDMIDPQLVKVIPEELARKYHVLPLFRVGNELNVVSDDPTNQEALLRIEEACGLKVKASLCNRTQILSFLDKVYYGKEAKTTEESSLEMMKVEEPPIYKIEGARELLKVLMLKAQRKRSWLIHIFPQAGFFKVIYQNSYLYDEEQLLSREDFNQILDFIKKDAQAAPFSCPPSLKYFLELDGYKIWIIQDEMAQGASLVMQIQQELAVIDEILPGDLLEDVEGLKSLGLSLFARTKGLLVVAAPGHMMSLAVLYKFMGWAKPISGKTIILEGLPVFISGDHFHFPYAWWDLGLEWGLKISRQQLAKIVLLDQIGTAENLRTLCPMVVSGSLALIASKFQNIPEIIAYLLNCLEPGLLAMMEPRFCHLRRIKLLCPVCKKLRDPDPEEKREVKALLGTEKLVQFPSASSGCSNCHFSGYKGERYFWEWIALNSRDLRELALKNQEGKDISSEIHPKLVRTKNLREFVSDLFLRGDISFEEAGEIL